MGLKKIFKNYSEYSKKELARRAAKYKSNVSKTNAYKSNLKKEIEEARKKTYRAEALKQAGAKGKLQAQRRFNTFGGLVKRPIVKKPIAKKLRKKKKVAKRRKIIKYVYS